ncbi:MAG: hypothetical protein I3273_07410 [Candidatus Moeniiplasma glomeromycotorum]|nr:hypothetical protein [Candidatus Moeniiplasma glomeromycotorum]MCE8168343.1 hypothetical protein [Candidatus Moeniiplasma glomeromycotorum]MCE8169914.1 hypothetical protein [Candidatus Moeniiplasma glomeromycotorum]
MAGKITTAEFQDWAQKFHKLGDEVVKNFTFKSPQERNQFIQVSAIAIFFTDKETLLAPFTGIENLNWVGIKVDNPLDSLGGLTFLAWENQIFQRTKGHCIAEGYYNPANPPNLTSLKERGNATSKILKGTNYLNRLLVYANPIEYKNITNTVRLRDKLSEIIPDFNKDDGGEIPREIDFIVADWVGRIEKLDNLLKQAEKSKPSTANSPPPANSDYSTNLGNEITDLKNQIKQLEDKNKNNSAPVNPAEKEVYQKLLEDIRKRLGDKEKEFQKIQKPEQKPKNNNLPLIIGVSAGVIIFLLIIIIIVLLARPSRHRD